MASDEVAWDFQLERRGDCVAQLADHWASAGKAATLNAVAQGRHTARDFGEASTLACRE